MKTIQVDYVFKNPCATTLKLWLALPQADLHHPDLNLQQSQPALATYPTGENLLAYYELAAGQEVNLTYSFRQAHYPLAQELSSELRQFYLRSSALVPVNQEIINYAQAHCAIAADALTQARQLFEHLVEHYRYQYPPQQRGALSMLHHKVGDCGEFSFLYAALCRARNIPCRVIFGAFANGGMAPHAWNEIYIAGQGWLPVDCSMAKIATSIWRNFSLGMTVLPWQAYFGELEGPRLVFSIDCDLLAPANYVENTGTAGLSMRMGEQDLRWGLQLLNGHFPYLQPAYVRLDDQYAQATTGWLEKLRRQQLFSKILGKWQANYSGNWRYPLQKTWTFAMYLYCAELALDSLSPQSWLKEIRSSTAMLLAGLTIALILWQIATAILSKSRRDRD